MKWHGTQSAGMHADGGQIDENVCDHKIASDKVATWSPKGTYLIVIKHDKIDFLGGQ